LFCRKHEEKYPYSARFLLDGRQVAHHMYTDHRRGPSEPAPINVKSNIRTSATEVRNFAFASLELTGQVNPHLFRHILILVK
jgi:hypothetical protein